MTHARGLYKPQATSEHHLHTKRFVSACSVHWYLLVPSTMKIATSRGLLRWLAGWLAALHYKPVQKKSNRRPRTATKSLRKRYEGPWVWLAYREERYLFSTHIVAPCFLTFVGRVHSRTFEGGIDAPRFLASEWMIGNRIDRVMSERDAGA